jgi:hypothetical protein
VAVATVPRHKWGSDATSMDKKTTQTANKPTKHAVDGRAVAYCATVEPCNQIVCETGAIYAQRGCTIYSQAWISVH